MTNECGHAAGSSGHNDSETRRECISHALGQYGGKVERDGRRWFVQLSASEGAALPNLLTALKQCLDENEIAAVKVELDGQTYAMEGLTKVLNSTQPRLEIWQIS